MAAIAQPHPPRNTRRMWAAPRSATQRGGLSRDCIKINLSPVAAQPAWRGVVFGFLRPFFPSHFHVYFILDLQALFEPLKRSSSSPVSPFYCSPFLLILRNENNVLCIFNEGKSLVLLNYWCGTLYTLSCLSFPMNILLLNLQIQQFNLEHLVPLSSYSSALFASPAPFPSSELLPFLPVALA